MALFRLHSLRAKLLAPFLLGMLTLTLLLSWYTYASARRTMEDAALLLAEAQTNKIVSSMGLLFRSLLSTAQNMTVDPHMAEIFAADTTLKLRAAAEWLEIYAQSNDYYRDIQVLDLNGICIASSNPGQIGMNYLDKPYVRLALGGMLNFGESSIGRVTKKLTTTLATPVDIGGKVVGALVLVYDLPQIADYTQMANSGPQAVFAAVVDASGLFVLHPDNSLMGNAQRLYPDLYRDLSIAGKQGKSVYFSIDGAPYLGYAMLEPTSKWVVFSCGKKDAVFAPAVTVGVTVFASSIFLLLIISFFVVRFANGILTSLFSLINYAKKVSEGDLEIDLADAVRDDELGTLRNALRRLVSVLREMLARSEEASRMKGEFLANMSHEIRTPLNAVIGMAHLSLRDTDISPRQKANLEQIQVAAKTLLGIINDILDISKIESGKLDLEIAPFNLREHIERTLSIHKANAKAKGLALNLEYGADAPERVLGDPIRLGQVLNNLLSNAIKFTMRGSVTVRVGLRRRLNEGEAYLIDIAVEDTGIGIDKASLDTLFQPFTQADASITRKFGGTGLGLAISDRLVEIMGGAFDVRSEVGKGSTFAFSTRLLAAPDGPESAADVAPRDGLELLNLSGRRILVVEDNMLNQMILEELIAPSNAKVATADNGQEAVARVRAERFDLIFMDMQMPIMDGLQATTIIRSYHGPDELPIIAVTANAMKEDQDKALASGMNDYITKPIEPNRLAEILARWLPPA